MTHAALKDLLPCPFCGSVASMYEPTCNRSTPYNPADRAFPVVRCECGAQIGGRDWDQRGTSAIAAWNRRASLKGEAVVPALEVFRIAGGDVECCPNPTAAEAMDCLRDLRQCYEESLTTPPDPQAVGVKLPAMILHDNWAGTANRLAKWAKLPSKKECLDGQTMEEAAFFIRHFLDLATTPSPAPQGGGEALRRGVQSLLDLYSAAEASDEPQTEHDLGYEQACAEFAQHLSRLLATPPAQQPGEDAIFAAARKYSTTGQDARMRQTFEFDDHGLREFVAALAPKENN